jgi:hypothetical protein
VIPKLEEFQKKGIKPTVGAIYYILESKNVKKREKEFTNSIGALSQARKKAQISIDSFSYNTRSKITNFDNRFYSIFEESTLVC